MRKLLPYLLIFLMLLPACGVGEKTVEVPKSIENLIGHLKTEDSRFIGKTGGYEISQVNDSCHKTLRLIISDYESLSLPASIIVDADSRMYLKIGEPLNLGKTKARIIEYGKKKADEGSSTRVYIQEYDDNRVYLTEVLTVVTNSTQPAKILNADLYEFSGGFYAVIGSAAFNIDSNKDYLKLTVLKHENNRWEPMSVRDYLPQYPLEIGYDLRVEKSDSNTNPGLKLLVRDDKGNVVNHRFLNLSNDEPTLMLYDRVLPADIRLDRVSPIVGSYIIGGSTSGGWLGVDYTFEELTGNEDYKVYSETDYLGKARGVSKQPVTEKVQGAHPDVDISFGTGLFEARPEPHGDGYANHFSTRIAVGAEWNALPRKPEVLLNDSDEYKRAVADTIARRGFTADQVNIRQVLKVDLEGDGVDETVITASNAEFPLSSGRDRTYSTVILRRLTDGREENLVLREEYFIDGKSDSGYGTTALYVPFILDVNGDGLLEVFIEGEYIPGSFTSVYQIKGRDAKEVLSNGISA